MIELTPDSAVSVLETIIDEHDALFGAQADPLALRWCSAKNQILILFFGNSNSSLFFFRCCDNDNVHYYKGSVRRDWLWRATAAAVMAMRRLRAARRSFS